MKKTRHATVEEVVQAGKRLLEARRLSWRLNAPDPLPLSVQNEYLQRLYQLHSDTPFLVHLFDSGTDEDEALTAIGEVLKELYQEARDQYFQRESEEGRRELEDVVSP